MIKWIRQPGSPTWLRSEDGRFDIRVIERRYNIAPRSITVKSVNLYDQQTGEKIGTFGTQREAKAHAEAIT